MKFDHNENEQLQVWKYFFDRFGRSIDIKRVKQGDLIAIKITLTNLEKSKVDNVVVTDMLPAGFEIENPRISENQDMPWIKDQSEPSYFDVRDDRINFFTNINSDSIFFSQAIFPFTLKKDMKRLLLIT